MESASHATYSIGEVVALLRPDYDISESNLRFWEKQGLLEPQRTPGGHRLYSGADIARIKLIKRMQSTRHMPLAAIKHLCAVHEGDSLDELAPFFEAMYRPQHFDADFRPLTAAELAAETGLALEAVVSLTDWGVLRPEHEGDEGPYPEPRYDEDDRQVCRLLAEILPTGVPLEAVGRKAALVHDHVQAEWEQVVRPMLPHLTAIPSQNKLRIKALMEEVELLLFSRARRTLRAQLLAKDPSGFATPCHPMPISSQQEER